VLIDLAEFLKCPADHPETYCVLAPHHMEGRNVVQGTLGCPTCRAEYPIRGGVVRFGAQSDADPGERPGGVAADVVWDPEAIRALLSLTSTGGHLVLVGSAGRIAPELAACLEGVHVVGVNAPPTARPVPVCSLLVSPHTIPLRSAVARGVVVGPDYCDEHWLEESARVLLRGQRLVVAAADVMVNGVRRLAAADGVWVGERTPEVYSS
jgi:uncharacterized protein YbaR (Trm112 family)